MSDFGAIAGTATWVATGIGIGLWLFSWFGVKDRIVRLRYYDCGLVLVFAAILLRVALQDRPLGALDWLFVAIGPVFIAAALWRLSRTGQPANGSK